MLPGSRLTPFARAGARSRAALRAHRRAALRAHGELTRRAAEALRARPARSRAALCAHRGGELTQRSAEVLRARWARSVRRSARNEDESGQRIERRCASSHQPQNLSAVCTVALRTLAPLVSAEGLILPLAVFSSSSTTFSGVRQCCAAPDQPPKISVPSARPSLSLGGFCSARVLRVVQGGSLDLARWVVFLSNARSCSNLVFTVLKVSSVAVSKAARSALIVFCCAATG